MNVVDVQFLHQIVAMRVRRFHAGGQSRRGLQITAPFSDQLEDLPLALREDVAFSFPSDREVILQDIKYHLLDGSRKVTASFYHMMDRFLEHRSRAILCDIT